MAEGTVALSSDHPLWDPAWIPDKGEELIKEKETTESPDITFFGLWASATCHRVWIALEELNVSYKWIEINPYIVDASCPGGYTKTPLSLEQKAAAYPDWIAACPKGVVPGFSIVDEDGKTHLLNESENLVCFLDDRYGSGNQETENTLMPESPFTRAYIRHWMACFMEKINKPFIRIVMGLGDPTELMDEYHSGYRELAWAMAPIEEGPFFAGQLFSQFDCLAAAQFRRYIEVGQYYYPDKLALPGREDPDFARIWHWWDAVSARPSYVKTYVCKQRLIDSNAMYASGKATSSYALQMKAQYGEQDNKNN